MVPLIIGIGIDDGIHIIHRYLEEGKGSLPQVIQLTGKAIFLNHSNHMSGVFLLPLFQPPFNEVHEPYSHHWDKPLLLWGYYIPARFTQGNRG